MMPLLSTLFTLMQAAGSVLGAGGSVFAELFYLRAIRDGQIDEAERVHLRIVATALRYGMLLLLVASAGLAITDFVYLVPTQPALTSAYWTEMGLAFAIIFFSWALSRRRIGFALGSAGVFSGWWFIAFLTLGRLPEMSFGAAVALYLVATAVIAAGLHYARVLTRTL